MKTIISDFNGANRSAALQIQALLAQKPDAALAFSTGRSMNGLFALLAQMSENGDLNMRRAKIFAVTEYAGTPPALSCRARLTAALLDRACVPPENRFFPSECAPAQYDACIAAAGGLDLAVLGLGCNAHIGYNEPGTQFDTATRIQTLAPATRRMLAERFGGEAQVPEKAVTMGIKTLTGARQILVLAFGREKADAVRKMLYARNDSAVPAAFLQLPLNVCVYADHEAAASL